MGDNQFQHHTKSWHTVICVISGFTFFCAGQYEEINSLGNEFCLRGRASCDPSFQAMWHTESDSSHLHGDSVMFDEEMRKNHEFLVVFVVYLMWVSKKYIGNSGLFLLLKMSCRKLWKDVRSNPVATLWIMNSATLCFFFLKKPNVNELQLGSKLLVLGMVIQPLIGNPYYGYINPYYWVDDHPLLYGNTGSLDPSTNGEHASLIRVWFVVFRNLLIDCKLIMNSGLTPWPAWFCMFLQGR